jgi:EmrB/QacA subfamily drug resistance transporter
MTSLHSESQRYSGTPLLTGPREAGAGLAIGHQLSQAAGAGTADDAAGPDAGGARRKWRVLAVLASCAFMAQLDLFIVNIALPAMSGTFRHAGLNDLSWVLNAYAIVFAALLVPAGRLADHFGRKRLLLTGIVVFTLASALCALAPTLGILVAGRVIQAAGAALIVPASLGLLLPAFPQRQHSLVVGIWAGVAAVAASSGPPVGGLLIGLSWRWVFLINVPIGVLALIGGRRLLSEVRARPDARLPDPLSGFALLTAVTLIVLATIQGPSWGWTSPATLGILAAGALAAAVTVRRTIRHPHAVIEATLFRGREFTAASVALFLFFIAFAAWLLITVLFLEYQWGYSALRAGLAIAPGPLAAAVFAVNSGRIVARFGRTAPALAGALAVAAGAVFWLLVTSAHPDYLSGFLPGLILAGIGSGLAQAPLYAAASTLPADRATTGSAVLTMSRQIGSAFGVALLVVLLATSHPDSLVVFHRGWILQAAAAAAAGVAILLLRPRSRARAAGLARPMTAARTGDGRQLARRSAHAPDPRGE